MRGSSSSSSSSSSSGVERLRALVESLGKVPDREIAERAGVSATTVGRFRRAQGIEAYEGYQFGKRADGNVPTGRRSKLENYRDVLGRIPDREIAESVGLTTEAVRIYRQRHGIEKRYGPKCRRNLTTIPRVFELEFVQDGRTLRIHSVGSHVQEALEHALEIIASRGLKGTPVGIRYRGPVLDPVDSSTPSTNS